MRFLDDHETFLCEISGGVGGCPPPVSPPVSPPPPPGIPALVGSPAGAVAGSKWVEGSEMHTIMSNGAEYQGTGPSVATPPGAIVGSNWVSGEEQEYIDASGVKRQLHKTSEGAKPAPAIQGSVWINSPSPAQQQHHWIGGTNRYRWHNGF